MLVDLSDLDRFDRRNLWQPDGQTITVRPGLRKLHTPTANHKFVGGFSIKSPTSGGLWHYLIEARDTTSPQVQVLRLDEDFTTIETLTLSGYRPPRVVTFAPVGQEMMICSPDLPPVRCVLGGHMEIAEQVASSNAINTTAIDIPKGIAVAWKNRVVIAGTPVQDAAAGLYFSDPGAPRTFVVENILPGPWASPVHGLHVSAQGALIVATETGIWAVPDGVVSGGQLLVPEEIGQLTDLAVYDYNQTCQVRGAVWALTRKALRQVFPEGTADVGLDEQLIPRGIYPRISAADFRSRGRIVASDLGPMVAYDERLFLLDLTTGHRGWWHGQDETDFTLLGVLHDFDGDELLLTAGGVYRLEGNFDGGEESNSETTGPVRGYFAGTVANAPTADLAPMRVVSKATGHGNALHAVNGELATTDVEQIGAVEGVASWASTTTKLAEQRLEQSTTTVADGSSSGEVSIEIGVEECESRLMPQVEIDLGASNDGSLDRDA